MSQVGQHSSVCAGCGIAHRHLKLVQPPQRFGGGRRVHHSHERMTDVPDANLLIGHGAQHKTLAIGGLEWEFNHTSSQI